MVTSLVRFQWQFQWHLPVTQNHTHMVKVYFEMKGYAELVATFADEELFELCLPILEQEAKEQGFEFVTESIEK